MPIRNANWYNLNSTRGYPLADGATGTDDRGLSLANDMLVDCHLRWPAALGQYAFLSGITVTANLVTVIILAADGATATTRFTPLAAVTLTKPVDTHRPYPVTPLTDGVGGYVVFGNVDTVGSYRFSGPAQSLLAPCCARAERVLPVTALRKLGRTAGLTGVVQLLAGSDIEIAEETIPVNGGVPALVFRLAQAAGGTDVLEKYIGDCGARPESNNCDRPGVEYINDVGPDCHGNINIVFEGVDLGLVTACGEWDSGIVAATSLGLADLCTEVNTTRFVGEDLCSTTSFSSLGLIYPSSYYPPVVEESSAGSDTLTCSIPYYHTLHDTFAPLIAIAGTFTNNENGPIATGTSWQNLAILPCDFSTYNKDVAVRVKLSNAGPRRNGGLVLNYRTAELGAAAYQMVRLDLDTNCILFCRYGGPYYVVEASAKAPLSLDTWYEIEVLIRYLGGVPTLTIYVRNLDEPSWPEVTMLVTSSYYGPSTGHFGFGTDRGVAQFAYFYVKPLLVPAT